MSDENYSSGTIYIDCPCCGARLEARRSDGKVVAHWEKAKQTLASTDSLKAAAEREGDTSRPPNPFDLD